MLPTIATGNVGSALAGEYEVANSLRFNDSSDKLSRTPSSDGNQQSFTVSFWSKRGQITANNIMVHGVLANADFMIYYNTSDQLQIATNISGTIYGLRTDRLFRDPSAWYHIVVSLDTTSATASSRIKVYINGSQETSLNNTSYPPQNSNISWNKTSLPQTIGYYVDDPSIGYKGYITEFVNIDGSTLTPTSFGEFDSDTNIWKPIDVSGLTFGTNGFYLDFENSGSLGADVSGQGNNFTVNNLTSIDQTTYTCTNNFATLNALTPTINTTHVYSNGNLTAVPTYVSAGGVTIFHTINPLQGKWYYEIKAETSAGSGNAVHTGVVTGTSATNYTSSSTQSGAEFDIYSNNIEKRSEGSSSVISGSSFSSGDIGMIAVDMDNGKIYIGKNGTWLESSNPATGSNPSVSFTVTNDLVFFTSPVTNSGNSNKAKVSMNFGNAPYSISSGNSDGNGYGNFEYAVPSGYYSLNTKNLAEYG